MHKINIFAASICTIIILRSRKNLRLNTMLIPLKVSGIWDDKENNLNKRLIILNMFIIKNNNAVNARAYTRQYDVCPNVVFCPPVYFTEYRMRNCSKLKN